MLGIVPDLRLGAAKIGDVGDAADDETAAVRKDEPVLAGDDGAHHTGRIGQQFLVDVGLAAFENQPVLGAEDVRLFLRHEIVVGLADQLLGAVPHQRAHRLVHQDEPAIWSSLMKNVCGTASMMLRSASRSASRVCARSRHAGSAHVEKRQREQYPISS